MTRIYTRTGDDGGTGLFGGQRVKKSHARVRAYGAVDEANSAIGVAASAADLPADLKEPLLLVLSDLFDLGAELATPPNDDEKLKSRLQSCIDLARVAELERAIDRVDDVVPPLTTFVLPTGSDAAARLHLARTVVRRAEREVVALADEVPLRTEVIVYLNRLSDLLFSWARYANHKVGVGDVAWRARKG